MLRIPKGSQSPRTLGVGLTRAPRISVPKLVTHARPRRVPARFVNVASPKGDSVGARKQPQKEIAVSDETKDVKQLGRTFIFACDDSDVSESGAQFLINRVTRPGDTVHFVHVISDDRSTSFSVGELSPGASLFSSTETEEAAHQAEKEHERHLEVEGEELMSKRFVKYAKQAEIRTEFHLPVVKSPDSAADVGEVLCEMAKELYADMLVLVTPYKGGYYGVGTVGFYCYEHVHIPFMVLPPVFFSEDVKLNETVMLVAEDTDQLEMVHSWAENNIPHLNDMGLEKVRLETLPVDCDVESFLRWKASDVKPQFVVMFSQAKLGVIEELMKPSFVAKYCAHGHYPAIILPTQRHGTPYGTVVSSQHLSRWADHSYDASHFTTD